MSPPRTSAFPLVGGRPDWTVPFLNARTTVTARRRGAVRIRRYDAAMLIITAAASTHRFKMAAAAAQGHTRVARTHARTRPPVRPYARHRTGEGPSARTSARIRARYTHTPHARARALRRSLLTATYTSTHARRISRTSAIFPGRAAYGEARATNSSSSPGGRPDDAFASAASRRECRRHGRCRSAARLSRIPRARERDGGVGKHG